MQHGISQNINCALYHQNQNIRTDILSASILHWLRSGVRFT